MTPAVARLHAEADADYARNRSPETQARLCDDRIAASEHLADARDLQQAVAYRPQSGGAR